MATSTMPDLLDPLRYGFVIRALIASTVVAIVCASVGVFVILRGLAFLGDAISHAAFPGVVVAFLLKTNIVVGGAIAAIGSAIAIGLITRRSRLREDATIGVVFAGMFALGVVLFSRIRTYTGDLLGILLGDVLAVTEDQLAVVAVAALVIVAALWIFRRELIFVSFDPTGAAAAGLPVLRYDALLLGLIGLAIAVSVQVVGIVLVVALLVTPAATARLLANDLAEMVRVTVAVALVSAVAGMYASYYLNTASGGTIVLVATLLFALTWTVRSVRERAARA
jgi:manganese/iron transport system permease protein